MRYYYKANYGKGFLNLKNPLQENIEEYTQITEEEFYVLTKPTEKKEPTVEQKAAFEKAKQISDFKKQLSNTDYIVLKISEAVAENDTNMVVNLRTMYATELANRKTWRNKINELENKK